MYDAAELSQLPGLLAGELISIGRALAGTTRENICAILDVAIARATVSESLAYERLENMLFAEQRADDAEIERDEAIARAEAAEARAAEFTNANNELARLNADLQFQIIDLQAALDAERAARQWRPVTAPPEEGQEVVIVIGARYWGEIEEGDNNEGAPVGWYYTDDGDYFGPEFPRGWLPLQEPTQ